MLKPLRFFPLLLLCVTTAGLSAGEMQFGSSDRRVELIAEPGEISLHFDASDVTPTRISQNGRDYEAFSLKGEGSTYDYGRPELPMVNRFVVVPNDAGLEFEYEVEFSRTIRSVAPPAVCLDEGLLNGEAPPGLPETGLYPPAPAEMSEPFVFRGVRMVKVTTYPVQYDLRSGSYVHNTQIRTNIRCTDDPPVNPAVVPVRRNRSRDFLKIIRRMAINGDLVGRDDPDRDAAPEYIGHYLVVTHQSCLQYATAWIDFRRRAGYKVDILSLSDNDARNPATVKARIQDRYNAYLNDGVDPFDMILLVGDIQRYDNIGQNGNWILDAERGWTIWGGGAPHADFLYACLEGGQNDRRPDVGISRWASGSQEQMGLTVNRTLAYAEAPRMQNPEWFGRGGVYSQHWGNGEQSAWHISIHTNVRWAEEVLEQRGFNDVRFYERYQWDRNGDVVGPWVANLFNIGVNVLLGRAENYYWRSNFQGVNVNTVFPIRIVLSGHGEWPAWSMWRAYPNGGPNQLRGPVATTFGWGGPATAPNNAMWLEMVHGLMQMDIPLGWCYSMALNMVEAYFPDFGWMGQSLYLYSKTDVNCYGDPGLKPWIGIPRVVSADVPAEMLGSTRQIPVRVYNPNNDQPVSGALVTFYAPGGNPDLVERDDSYKLMAWTDDRGRVQFVIPEGRAVPGPRAYVTISGRDIRPLVREVVVRANLNQVELGEYVLDETEGNRDGVVNPGESFSLLLTARNMSAGTAMQDVRATVSTASPWIEIVDDQASFGDLAAGAQRRSNDAVTFRVHASCPDGVSRPITRPVLNIQFTSGNNTFQSAIKLEPHAPHFQFVRVVGGDEIPADRRSIDLEISNVGSMNSPASTGTLWTQGLGVSVVLPSAEYPAIATGRAARIQGDRFLVAGNRIAVPGSRTPMMLVIETVGGFIDTVYFDVQVSAPRQGAPQGPDPYGYICFDDTDDEWDMAPTYEWLEINPRDNDAEYEGVSCQFSGQSEFNVGESRVVPLGFETQFYGRVFDRITIATNGFVAMGNQPRITNPQNWPMDHAIAGGAGMIAPFWDWLAFQANVSQVYYYYDEENARFIVEWYRLRHHGGGQTDLTFQLILYDRDVWITETGDQNILIQYKSIAQARGPIDGGVEREKNNPYATVGISSPDGTSGMTYTWLNQYPVTSAPLANRRAILFATSPRYRSGTLFGQVTDAADGQPIQGATVFTEHGFTATTDEEGRWRIADALADVPFNITVVMQGYNDFIREELVVDEDDTLEINFAMLHPEFLPSHEFVRAELEPDERTDVAFTIQNQGNGPLNWRLERQLRGGANANPWELRNMHFVGERVNDDRIEGVVFADGHFYVSGSANQQPRIYVFDRNGGLVRSFRQPVEDIRGMRDLAWDGQLIWGAIRDRIYGITTEGEVVREFQGPINPITTIDYDPDLDVLWFSSTTTDIMAVTRDGQLRNNLTLNRRELRLYGLAYWPEDRDGFNLYVFHRDRDNNLETVHKFNTRTGDTLFVRYLEPPRGGSPGGAYITNELDVYSWVFLGISSVSRNDGGDRIDIYQLDARRDWFRIEPTTGTIAAGAEQEFTVTLDAAGLPTVRFEGDIVWYHNADDGRFTLPVTLDVLGGRRNLTLALRQGWNLISANVEPDNLDIRALMAPLVQSGVLDMVKDGAGRFYRPHLNFNNIPGWDVTQGYQVALSAEAQLQLSGVIIPSDTPIELDEGWNIAAYFPRTSMGAPEAFAALQDNLLIAKDGDGRFYLPEFNFSNMGNLSEGKGYQVKLEQAGRLTYPVGGQAAALAQAAEPTTRFSPPTSGAGNMSVLLIAEESTTDWEAAVLDSRGVPAGAGRFDAEGRCGIAVWGDDPASAEMEGALEGAALKVRLWNGFEERDAVVSPLRGEARWISDGLFVGRVEAGGLPAEFGLKGAYPNPANGPMRFMYSMTEGAFAKLTLHDLTGRRVAVLDEGFRRAGYHQLAWNTETAPSGLYIVRLEAAGRVSSRKVAVVK